MQVLCKLLLYNFYITEVHDQLYTVHPMKYLESDTYNVQKVADILLTMHPVRTMHDKPGCVQT